MSKVVKAMASLFSVLDGDFKNWRGALAWLRRGFVGKGRRRSGRLSVQRKKGSNKDRAECNMYGLSSMKERARFSGVVVK